MSFLISDAMQEASQELNVIGQRISSQDFILFFHRANKYFFVNYKMPTCQRVQDMLVFEKVLEYPLPTDFIGAMELERAGEETSPTFSHTTQKEFMHYINGNLTAFKFDRENQFMLINYAGSSTAANVNIHDMDDNTSNGTWAVGGDGSALAKDEQIFTEGNGSLRFTVTGSTGTTTLTNSTLSSIDITDYITGGYLFLDVQNPSATYPITSLTIRLGSDASNYYEVSATTRYRGDAMNKGWGPIGFDLSTKTTTGSPDDTDITYARISMVNDVAVTGTFRVDNFFLGLPTYFQLPYYSKYNVKDTTGAYIERPTAVSDTILCPSDFNEAFTYKVCEMAAALKLEDAASANYFRGELLPKERYLMSKYPRQEIRTQTNFYKRANKF